MGYVIPLVSFVVPLIYAAAAMRRALHRPVGVAALVLGAGLGWSIWQGRQASGWDGVVHAVVALLIVTPALLGLGAGALIGWWRRRARGVARGRGLAATRRGG